VRTFATRYGPRKPRCPGDERYTQSLTQNLGAFQSLASEISQELLNYIRRNCYNWAAVFIIRIVLFPLMSLAERSSEVLP
jgi:hypothetical protein